MQKVFRNKLLASLLLSVSAFAAESNLLALATGGAVSAENSVTVALNDTEMKNVVGGTYAWGGTNIASPIMKQTWGSVTDTYQGSKLWLIAEKYGSTLSSGYNVYLSATTNNSSAPTKHYNSNYQYVYNTPALVTNPTTYGIISPYLNTVLAKLSTI